MPFGQQSSGHTVPELKLLKTNKKDRETRNGGKIFSSPIGNSFSGVRHYVPGGEGRGQGDGGRGEGDGGRELCLCGNGNALVGFRGIGAFGQSRSLVLAFARGLGAGPVFVTSAGGL